MRTLSDIVAYNEQHPDRVRGQTLLQASDLTLGNVDEPTAIANRTVAIEGSRAVIDLTLTADDLDAIGGFGPVNANVGAAAGYPTVIVPTAHTDLGTRPHLISFLGATWSEARLLGYAFAYEQATHHRIPPTEANAALTEAGCPVPARGLRAHSLTDRATGTAADRPNAAGDTPRDGRIGVGDGHRGARVGPARHDASASIRTGGAVEPGPILL